MLTALFKRIGSGNKKQDEIGDGTRLPDNLADNGVKTGSKIAFRTVTCTYTTLSRHNLLQRAHQGFSISLHFTSEDQNLGKEVFIWRKITQVTWSHNSTLRTLKKSRANDRVVLQSRGHVKQVSGYVQKFHDFQPFLWSGLSLSRQIKLPDFPWLNADFLKIKKRFSKGQSHYTPKKSKKLQKILTFSFWIHNTILNTPLSY